MTDTTYGLDDHEWSEALGAAFAASHKARFHDEEGDPATIGVLAGEMHAEGIAKMDEMLEDREQCVAALRKAQGSGDPALVAQGLNVLAMIDVELRALGVALGGEVAP